MASMNIPFLDLASLHRSIRDPLEAAFQRVVDSNCFVLGCELEAFEQEFAEYCGVKNCIGVGNGLEAIRLLLKAYDIGPGDEVLVPSNTFIATWLAVTDCGATPVPVEPNIATHNIDPKNIVNSISSRTRAIIPVHLYGQPADMDLINQYASKYDLVVIEDAAQSQGALYKGRMSGSLGHAAATSFYPGKNLGALGDGGAVLTDDDAIAAKVKKLRNYGSNIKYQHDLAGYNSRLDEMQAAFLRTKLMYLDGWNEQRKVVAHHYSKALLGVDIDVPFVPDYADPVWHLYVIKTSRRDELQDFLAKLGVCTGVHYPTPPHRQKCYADYSNQDFPIADILANQVLSLPISPAISINQIEYVASSVNKFFKK